MEGLGQGYEDFVERLQSEYAVVAQNAGAAANGGAPMGGYKGVSSTGGNASAAGKTTMTCNQPVQNVHPSAQAHFVTFNASVSPTSTSGGGTGAFGTGGVGKRDGTPTTTTTTTTTTATTTSASNNSSDRTGTTGGSLSVDVSMPDAITSPGPPSVTGRGNSPMTSPAAGGGGNIGVGIGVGGCGGGGSMGGTSSSSQGVSRFSSDVNQMPENPPRPRHRRVFSDVQIRFPAGEEAWADRDLGFHSGDVGFYADEIAGEDYYAYFSNNDAAAAAAASVVSVGLQSSGLGGLAVPAGRDGGEHDFGGGAMAMGGPSGVSTRGGLMSHRGMGKTRLFGGTLGSPERGSSGFGFKSASGWRGGSGADAWDDSDEAAIRKVLASNKLPDAALMDPKRARRILANRQSAARSKERKMKYISELERKVHSLQTEATTLSAQLTMLQRDTHGLTNENTELKHRLRQMEQQAQLRDAFNDALRDEVQRLKLATAHGAAAVAAVSPQGNQGMTTHPGASTGSLQSMGIGPHVSQSHTQLHLPHNSFRLHIHHQQQQQQQQIQEQQQQQQQIQEQQVRQQQQQMQEHHRSQQQQQQMGVANTSSPLSGSQSQQHQTTIQAIKKEQADFLAVHAASFGTLAALSGSSFLKPDDSAGVPVPQGSGSYGC